MAGSRSQKMRSSTCDGLLHRGRQIRRRGGVGGQFDCRRPDDFPLQAL